MNEKDWRKTQTTYDSIKIMPCIYRTILGVFQLKQLLEKEVLREYQQRLYKIVSNVITYHQYINAWTCIHFEGREKWREEEEDDEEKTH